MIAAILTEYFSHEWGRLDYTVHSGSLALMRSFVESVKNSIFLESQNL